jgi:hypothetical protein
VAATELPAFITGIQPRIEPIVEEAPVPVKRPRGRPRKVPIEAVAPVPTTAED